MKTTDSSTDPACGKNNFTGCDKPRHHRRRLHRKHHGREARRKIVLVGSPNVGKSVIFGQLTGKYVDVSNYPGTSVEITLGVFTVGGREYELVDSPGVNSLVPRSEDEQVTLDIITDPAVCGIIQVIDAKNLKRGLMLTHQLAAMGFPLVVCLNIYDEAIERGIEINVPALEKAFGINFIPTVAVDGQGMPELRLALLDLQISHHLIRFHPEIEASITRISEQLTNHSLNPRGLALNIIAAGGNVPRKLPVKADFPDFARREVAALTKKVPASPGYEIQTAIAGHVEHRTTRYMKFHGVRTSALKDKLGWLTMHRYWGIPFILLVLVILYELVGVFGAGVCVDFIETQIFGGMDDNGNYFGLINPAFMRVLAPLGNAGIGGFFHDMLVGEYGVITIGLTYSIAIVFPVVSLFFIFFGIIEDSGYLPRLTVMSNRHFQRIGLNGRAILPMVLGLGCDTMATFTTRILETKKERNIATLLLALGIPCSAQLGVILGMMSAISFWLLMVVVITVALQLLIVGYGASRLLKGKSSPLIAEVPPLRMPRLKNILFKTYFRVKLFMKEAVPLFILGTLVLFLLERFHILVILEKISAPIIKGMLQLPVESTQAFIVGFLRRDYGAAGLFRLADQGLLDNIQITVGVTVMVLFVPCLANFFVIIKERGMKVAMAMSIFIVAYAMIIGAVLNKILRLFL